MFDLFIIYLFYVRKINNNKNMFKYIYFKFNRYQTQLADVVLDWF